MSQWIEYYSAYTQLKGNELKNKFPMGLLTSVQLNLNF